MVFVHGEIPKGGNSSFITLILKSQCNIDTIIRVLDVFHRAPGLRINMNKSNLVGISVDSNKVKHAAAKIGCLVLKTPFNYLGSRVGDFMSRTQSWHDVTKGMHSRVVKALHGEDEKIGKKVQPRYPSTWLNIINGIESLTLHGIDLVSFITPKLGNGANTSFWDVACCRDISFKNLVPRLYALESMKNIKVASKLSHGGLEFSFRRNPRGGVEQAQFERLKETVKGVTLSNSNDRWSWSLVGSGDFSMSSVTKLIDNAILPKDLISPEEEECPQNIRLGVVKNMKKPSQTSRGVLVGLKVGFKPPKEYRPVPKKHTASSSDNKKKGVEPTNEVSNLNPFEVLNSVDNDMELGTNEGATNLVNNRANTSGSLFMNTTLVMDKIRKFVDSLIDGQAILVDEAGNPLKKVEYPGDVREGAHLRIHTPDKVVKPNRSI
nr:RNA-directed DNA polymerase, eukaryota, reverse transcriptase zinc-binding domain protein [Tanacetum cinerariifolium]